MTKLRKVLCSTLGISSFVGISIGIVSCSCSSRELQYTVIPLEQVANGDIITQINLENLGMTTAWNAAAWDLNQYRDSLSSDRCYFNLRSYNAGSKDMEYIGVVFQENSIGTGYPIYSSNDWKNSFVAYYSPGHVGYSWDLSTKILTISNAQPAYSSNGSASCVTGSATATIQI